MAFNLNSYLVEATIQYSSDLPPPPAKPERFTSKQQLKDYLVKLHEYYAIIGRPRFGRSFDMNSINDNNLDLNYQIEAKNFLPYGMINKHDENYYANDENENRHKTDDESLFYSLLDHNYGVKKQQQQQQQMQKYNDFLNDDMIDKDNEQNTKNYLLSNHLLNDEPVDIDGNNQMNKDNQLLWLLKYAASKDKSHE